MTTIALIGVGKIGMGLARRLTRGGVDVLVALSTLDKARTAAAELGDHAQAADVADALAAADIAILATPFATIKELLTTHADALAGTIVVDPSNNVALRPDGTLANLNPDGVSAASQLVPLLGPDTRYVKAFGALGADQLATERAADGEVAALLYATDDDTAGDAVAEVIRRGGWDALKVGGVDQAARIEVFGDLHTYGGLAGNIPSASSVSALIH